MSMPVSERVKCGRCGAMVLEVTARRNRGYCGVCARTQAPGYRLKQVGRVLLYPVEAVLLLVAVVAIPFVVLWCGVRDAWRAVRHAWRRWRFPYDREAMLARIVAVHVDDWVARRYLEDVIDGYWDGYWDGEEKFVSPWPSIAGDDDPMMGVLLGMRLARLRGLADGARLRCGEITVEEVPTWRESLDEADTPMKGEGGLE